MTAAEAFSNEPKFSTVETAKILNLHPMTVRRVIREGRLGAYRIGTKYLVGDHHIAAFIEANEITPKAS